MPDLKVLISRQDVARRVSELGAQITKDYAGQSVILVGVLKGAAIFLSDLARHVDLDATFDFIGVSSYANRPSPTQELQSGWDSTGEVKLTKDVDQSMNDKNVILVEDILDTGLTMTYLKKLLMARQPRSLKVAALLDKPSAESCLWKAITLDLKSPMNMLWATASITRKSIATSPIFVWYRENKWCESRIWIAVSQLLC